MSVISMIRNNVYFIMFIHSKKTTSYTRMVIQKIDICRHIPVFILPTFTVHSRMIRHYHIEQGILPIFSLTC